MSAGDYPLPASAAYIWTVGDKLYLGLPGEAGQGHTVVIPLDKMIPDTGMTGLPKAHHRGFAVLIETLRQREINPPGRQWIGTRAAPPKHTVEQAIQSDEKYQQWLDAMGAKKAEDKAAKAEAEEFLRELNL